jgi:phosphomannomutase
MSSPIMSVNFGTSGLRGPAEDFTAAVCAAYVAAFLETCCAGAADRTVIVAADLRASSPRITAAVVAAAGAAGWRVVHAGTVPTPALAAYALARTLPAIMVTGSHIPEIYNGIKFYRPDGEFLKEDEAPVRARAEALLASAATPETVPPLPPADPAIAAAYVARALDAFPGRPLAGLVVGVDEHSAVGRALTIAVLSELGATVKPFRHADHFIAVDTEAVAAADLDLYRRTIAAEHLDAVVSTDGDGDRPLVVDDAGRQITGDVLGALTARALGITTIVTPLTSTTALEASGWFTRVIRTRIGSPYVVAAMAAAEADTGPDAGPVAGFEANGGFLLGGDLAVPGGLLARLPTRDALLPIIATLALAVRSEGPLSALPAQLPPRVMKADRLKQVAPADGAAFLAAVATSAATRAALDPSLADVAAIDRTDGVRLTLADGAIAHFRQSGNAPELRCYVETDTAAATDTLLARLLAATAAHLAAGH